MASVTLKKVEKYYGDVHAVKGIDIQVLDKEFLCLLGPSGCGKSTTLRMVAGLEAITRGEIYIGETLVNDLAPKDRDVAMVFENYALYPHKNVFENMAYPLRIRKHSQEQIESRVRRAAEILEITELLERGIAQLSGGQKQRVAIGRAIVREPKVFLMDEPISHLDARLRTHMRGELKHLQRVLNTTMLYVTHDQLEAISMADRIVIMHFGEIQQIGTPDEIFNHPANMIVAGFVGDPPMNFVRGSVMIEGERAVFQNQGVRVELSKEQARTLSGQSIPSGDKPFVLGVRPEDVSVFTEKRTEHHAAGKVYVSSPIGKDVVIEIEIDDTHFKSIAPVEESVAMNQGVWVKFNVDKIHIFRQDTKEIVF